MSQTAERTAEEQADEGTGPLQLMCAWCRRLKDGRGAWTVRALDTVTKPVSHGICPACEAEALDAAERRCAPAAAKEVRTADSLRPGG